MLVRGTVPSASLIGGQTRSCFRVLFSQLKPRKTETTSSTLTNFSIEEIPQAGPDPGVPEPPRCLTAPARRASEQTSRQEVAIPAAGQPWGRGAGRQGGSPGSGGGAVPVQGSEQGAAALRAGGFQLRKDPGGLGTARSQVIRGPKCQSWGLRTGGFRDALCTGPPPPPPSSTLGSLGWDQAFSNQSAAAVEPEPGAVNQLPRGGFRGSAPGGGTQSRC
ncbi:uncharacterized protein LOC144329737 [Macaca mulatta]